MKTQTKHTPGPWVIVKIPNLTERRVVIHGGKGGMVCDVDWGRTEETNANAALIAAAPELLNALQLTLATLERVSEQRGMFSSIQGTLDVAKAAITKAEAQT